MALHDVAAQLRQGLHAGLVLDAFRDDLETELRVAADVVLELGRQLQRRECGRRTVHLHVDIEVRVRRRIDDSSPGSSAAAVAREYVM